MKPGTICSYCEKGATTMDHIPPRSLYPDGTEQMITVPSCDDCGPAHSSDDEFFKTLMVLCSNPANPIAADHLTGSVKRCLEIHSPGLRKKLMSQVRTLQDDHPHNLHGEKNVIEISDADWARIQKVLKRIVKGLYFHGSGKKYAEADFDFVIADGESEAAKNILDGLPGMRDTIKRADRLNFNNSNACVGKVIVSAEDPDDHLWCLSFYEKKSFLIFAIRRSRA
jgi:hypothetical protein